MLTYQLEITSKARKQLSQLDKPVQARIMKWIQTHLQNTTNPRQHGKGLTGDRSGEWRYRVGNYRLIATIHDNIITIEIFQIEHRSTVYKLKR